MTIEELKETGAIYFERIQTGLHRYANEIVILKEKDAYDKFIKLWKINGPEHGYVDFYYYELNDAARERVDLVLTVPFILPENVVRGGEITSSSM